MKTSEENQQYYQLEIHGNSNEVDIWIGDDEGHPVQKAEGTLSTCLLAGNYIIEFGLGSQCYPIELKENLLIT